MASAGAYAAAGLTLLALHSRGKKSELLLLLFAGIALGIEFVSKPSSGVVTLGLVIAWVLIFGRQLSAKMSGVAVTIAGLTACVLLLAMTQTTLSDSSHALTRGLDLFRMVQTEPTTDRLWRYVLEFTQHSLTALLKFSVPILVAALYLYTRRALFLILTAIALAHTIWFDGYFLGGSHHRSSAADRSFRTTCNIPWLNNQARLRSVRWDLSVLIRKQRVLSRTLKRLLTLAPSFAEPRF